MPPLSDVNIAIDILTRIGLPLFLVAVMVGIGIHWYWTFYPKHMANYNTIVEQLPKMASEMANLGETCGKINDRFETQQQTLTEIKTKLG
jgi:hypothetical protein